MKRTLLAGLIVCLIVMAMGCASMSERAHRRNAADVYATTLSVLADARRAGLIDDAQAAEIEEWRVLARQALDAWREGLEAGSPTESAIERFNQAIGVLWRAQINVQRRKAEEARSDGQVRRSSPDT